MSRSPVAFLIALALTGGGCERTQSQRTISYTPHRPIAERLLPADRHVVVEMKSTPPSATAGPQQSFEQELQKLKRSGIIALVRVTATAGEIADQGTWIRTTVNADVDRVVKAPAGKPLGESMAFTFAGGTANIGNVVVTTGRSPQFSEGEQYLVFLEPRGGAAPVWAGAAFRVDAQGVMQRVKITDGGEQTFPTNLVGRTASDVMDALAR